MYHWNTKALVSDIKNQSVSEHEKMKYFLACSLLLVLGSSYTIHQFSEPNQWTDYAMDIFTVLSTVFGTMYIYRANGNKSAFVEKTICISWPITIKVLVIFPIISVLVLILQDNQLIEKGFADTLDFLVVALGEVFIYARLGYWLRQT